MSTHQHDLLLQAHDLGRITYGDALARQRRLNQAVIDGFAPPTLLLLEHDPVVTLTPRTNRTEHLRASAERLAAMGIAVAETDRGGLITYHGPGQLVAYPILRLAPFGLNLGRYMRLLEEVVIETVGAFGIRAFRVDGDTGVYARDQGSGIRDQEENPEPHTAKLCALGVRIRRNVTMHGLALNVTTDLDHFNTIVPCGRADQAVTSMAELLGDNCPDMTEVKQQLVASFNSALSRRVLDAPEPVAR